MEKIAALFMAGLIALGTFGATEKVDGITWTYVVRGSKAIVGDGENPAIDTATTGAIAIPSKLGGRTVIGISTNAFFYCTGITSVTMPDTITTIAPLAFLFCSSLTSVTFSEGLVEIGLYAFNGCGELASLSLPDFLETIPEGAFGGCSALTSVEIPNGVTFVGDGAFAECYYLTSVSIPNCVTCLADIFPDSYSSLTNVQLSAGRREISDSLFAGCERLTSVTIPSRVERIGEKAFEGCSALTAIEIPDGVTEIGEEAFAGCSALTSVAIPPCVTCMMDTFPDAYSTVTEILLSYDFTELPDDLLSGCESIVTIEIPEGVENIGERALASCRSLAEVTLPDTVTNIGAYAFCDCSNLTAMELGEGLLSIGEDAFDSCENLTVVTLPTSVTSIGVDAFWGCSRLIGISVAEGNAAYAGDNGLLLDKDLATLLVCPGGLVTTTVRASVTRIAERAFARCAAMTNIVFLGNAPAVDDEAPFADVAEGCTATVSEGTTGWDDDGDGMWEGLRLIGYKSDPFPDLGPSPTAEQIAAVLGKAADPMLAEKITTGTNYEAFRAWANTVKRADGEPAGAQAVKNSPCAWQFFAFASDVLLAAALTDADLSFVRYAPTGAEDRYDCAVAVKGILVGGGVESWQETQRTNLLQVFGVDGSTTLKSEDFSAGNVEVAYLDPEEGWIRFTAAPAKEVRANSFFTRVRIP